MLRFVVVAVLSCASPLLAAEPLKLTAPAGWGGETIKLPPGFAPEMKLQGVEHIRFAPGMMKPDSDSFFCYAFVFELQPQPRLTDVLVKDEFLKYYRGLCQAVLNGAEPQVDPAKFTLTLRRKAQPQTVSSEQKSDSPEVAEPAASDVWEYTGVLDWIEPFATKQPQKLNLELRVWTANDHQYIFACVSPQPRDAKIWTQLRKIRDDYLNQ